MQAFTHFLPLQTSALRTAEKHLWIVDNLLTIAIVAAVVAAGAFIGYMLLHNKRH